MSILTSVLVLLGSAGLGALCAPGPVGAGERDPGKGDKDQVLQPLMIDDEIEARFRGRAPRGVLGSGSFSVVREDDGEQAAGYYVLGRVMFDAAKWRRVVINPGAVQDYYQFVRGLPREAAMARAERLIKRIERTGRPRKLDALDRGLRDHFGTESGAGTRLDDAGVFARFPAQQLATTGPLADYRRAIAGDDLAWEAHRAGDPNQFSTLRAGGSERFHRPVDPKTGASAAQSPLRARTYRRVLIDRHSRRRASFLPRLPKRVDLADAGLAPDTRYLVRVTRGLPSLVRSFLSTDAGRIKLRKRRGAFETVETTLQEAPPVFRDRDSVAGGISLRRPRIVNMTPPNGEGFVDPTTDWEDPDAFWTPVQRRRTFRIRIRFPGPLHPATVSSATFRMEKIRNGPDEPLLDTPVQVAIDVDLDQHRLGKVEVVLTPKEGLSGWGQYRVVIDGRLRSLGGRQMGADFNATFDTH